MLFLVVIHDPHSSFSSSPLSPPPPPRPLFSPPLIKSLPRSLSSSPCLSLPSFSSSSPPPPSPPLFPSALLKKHFYTIFQIVRSEKLVIQRFFLPQYSITHYITLGVYHLQFTVKASLVYLFLSHHCKSLEIINRQNLTYAKTMRLV